MSIYQWLQQGIAGTAFETLQGVKAQLHLPLLQMVLPWFVGTCQHLDPDDFVWPLQNHCQVVAFHGIEGGVALLVQCVSILWYIV